MSFFGKMKKSPQDEERNSNQKLVDQVVNSSQESDEQDQPDQDQDDVSQFPATQIDSGQPGNDIADDMNGDLDPEQEQDLNQDQDADGMPDQEEDHGPIDPSMDADQDGFVNHDEAEDATEDQDSEMDGEPSGQMIYMSGDGDAIGAQVGQAVLHDDEQALHEISNAINEGNSLVTDWVEENGGTVISAGGDEFIVMIPSELESQLEDVREAYSKVVGATLTLGIGNAMSEAGKALIFGKLHGKDQIAHYDPSMEEFLDSVYAAPQSEEDKQNEHYLGSLHGDQDPASAGDPSAMDPNAPVDPNAPMDPNAPPVDPSLEMSDQQVAELPPPGEMAKDETSLRDKMLQVVESFGQEKETIKATEKENPELYQAFMTSLSSLIDLARKLGPQAQPQTDPTQEPAPDMSEPLQAPPEDDASGEPQP